MLLCQYYATEETPVELPKHPISATREWPQTPTTPSFRRPPPALVRPPTGVDDEFEKEFGLHVLEKELRGSNSSSPASDDPPPRPPTPEPLSPMPPLGDEVLLEFGRPPLKDGLRPWSETFGKRTCIYGTFSLLRDDPMRV